MVTYEFSEVNGCISVLTQTGVDNHREVLVPGQFDRAKELLSGELYAEVEALWTPEVTAMWKDIQNREWKLFSRHG